MSVATAIMILEIERVALIKDLRVLDTKDHLNSLQEATRKCIISDLDSVLEAIKILRVRSTEG